MVDLCRTMEHGIGRGTPAPAPKGRSADGVDSASCVGSVLLAPIAVRSRPLTVKNRRLRPTATRRPCRPGPAVAGAGPCGPCALFSGWRSWSSPTTAVSRRSCPTRRRLAVAAREMTPQAHRRQDFPFGLDRSRPGRSGGAATRDNLRHVGRRPARREMVCKGHPCIYAADGNPMTRFASPWTVPRGLRSPRKLTDVHGREG